ncbi:MULTISPECIES: GntR family transcriptional regulator [unclassified Streptomyces]|uniref:GntR family transcriptional regulator n=1 Tax=unclassified Streptomyces TaxID=2593676 RepID=UPI002F91958C|nr:GntR family transcriptional regulator [Streptomyces sp. NBC_00826]WTB60757.1 GntR family transcriptional regulator [Streptomyces sp. NBC_00826]
MSSPETAQRVPAYRQLANHLRAAIARGEYAPGDVLPHLRDLAAQYGMAKQTASQAITELEDEGLVQAVRRRGTVVRPAPSPEPLPIGRRAFEEGLVSLRPATVAYVPAPGDVAARMGLSVGDEVFVHDRVLGTPEGTALRLVTRYVPASIARAAGLDDPESLDSIQAVVEAAGRGALRRSETITARSASVVEREVLALPRGVCLQRVLHVLVDAAGDVLELVDWRWSAEAFELTRTLRS